MKSLPFLILLALASLACSLTGPSQAGSPTPDVAQMVSATLTAVAANPQPAPALPTETPASEQGSATGVVSGSLQYPSSFIPAMRIAAFPLDGSAPIYVDTVDGQSSYEIELPPGQYHFVAYTMDGFFAGGYTAAVPCGLTVDCTDHSLLTVTVTAGQATPGILPVDFYAPEGAFPPMP